MSKIDRLDPSSLSSNPRATLPCWLKYQHIFAKAYSNPPGFLFVPNAPNSLNSLSAKLRDAIRGALAFGYPVAFCSLDELKEWYERTIISYNATGVLFGKGERKVVPLEERPSGLMFSSLTDLEISAFVVLISSGRLSGPVTILHPTEKQKNMTSPSPNCLIAPNDNGRLLLL